MLNDIAFNLRNILKLQMTYHNNTREMLLRFLLLICKHEESKLKLSL